MSGLGLRSTAFLGTTAVSVTVPTAPQSFSATAASSTQINLSWAAPASNGGASITSYTLRRNGTLIYSGLGTSFSDTGLTPGNGYSYTVLATNSAGNGPTASASATTSANPPNAPTITSSGGAQEPVYDEFGESIVGYITRHYISSPYTNNNGSAITSSTLVRNEGGFITYSTQSYPSGESWEVTIPVDFENNDAVLFNVYHTNAAGNSALSNTITLST